MRKIAFTLPAIWGSPLPARLAALAIAISAGLPAHALMVITPDYTDGTAAGAFGANLVVYQGAFTPDLEPKV